MPDPNLLFVYGTLRRGCSNDIARLVPLAVPVATAVMRGRMYDLGSYPTLVLDPAGGRIAGEVYAVPDSGWAALDALEEVVTASRPAGHYFRVAATAECDDGRTLTCQVYVANPAVQDLRAIVGNGDWVAWATARGRG